MYGPMRRRMYLMLKASASPSTLLPPMDLLYFGVFSCFVYFLYSFVVVSFVFPLFFCFCFGFLSPCYFVVLSYGGDFAFWRLFFSFVCCGVWYGYSSTPFDPSFFCDGSYCKSSEKFSFGDFYFAFVSGHV
jgi:hypothetical protein